MNQSILIHYLIQFKARKKSGTAADITYTYDTLHGWLKGISSPSGFNENILHETAAIPQYSGNIGSMLWSNTTNGEQHRYDFEYDRLGRLTDSRYSSSANDSEGRFDESVTYNCQGAITSLLRNGMMNNGTIGLIDDLSINYDGNHLLHVTDEADPLYYDNAQDFKDGTDMTTEYEYDNMGALVRDRNRVINNITYDLAGNPVRIKIDNGLGEIENDYTSDGVKLYSHHVTRFTVGSLYCITTTDMYVDSLIMRNNSPMMWRYDGGYVSLDYTGAPSIWNFYVTDHIGSTRMVVDSNNQVKDVINYYPYGGEITMTNPTQPPAYVNRQPFRFSGKELDNINGLRMYDFGARWYDVAGVPLWTSIDPMAEDNYSVTPYSYCNGDPVNRIDPDGMDDYYSMNGNYLGTNKAETDYIFISYEGDYSKMKDGRYIINKNNRVALAEANLNAESYSRIFTNSLRLSGFDTDKLADGKIQVTVWDNVGGSKVSEDYTENSGNEGNALASTSRDYSRGALITAYVWSHGKEEKNVFSSRSNIVNLLVDHEFNGHYMYNRGYKHTYGESDPIYYRQKKAESWKRTTKQYKEYINKTIKENGW